MSLDRPAIPDFVKGWLAPEKREALREAVETLAEAKFDEAGREFIPNIRSARWSTELLRMLSALARAGTVEECRKLWPSPTEPAPPPDRSSEAASH